MNPGFVTYSTTLKTERTASAPRLDLDRVAFAVWHSGTQANGGVESISAVIEKLPGQPLVLSNAHGSSITRWERAGCTVRKLAFGGGRTRHEQLASYIRANSEAFRILSSARIRLVHCNDIRSFWSVALAAHALRLRVVLNVRAIKAPEDQYGFRWTVARRLADSVLLLSSDMRQEFLRRTRGSLGSSTGSVRYIYSAVEPSRFHPLAVRERECLRNELGIPHRTFAVGYVAALCPRKDQATFLKNCCARITDPRVHFYFIGDDDSDYARTCRQLARDEGIGDRCSFVGYTSDPTPWYQALDLTVLASKREGLARAMIESLACGTPVISFDVTSAREVLEGWGAGLVLERGDYDGLASAIARLSGAGETHALMSERGLAFAEKMTNPDTVADEYLELYRDLLDAY